MRPVIYVDRDDTDPEARITVCDYDFTPEEEGFIVTRCHKIELSGSWVLKQYRRDDTPCGATVRLYAGPTGEYSVRD